MKLPKFHHSQLNRSFYLCACLALAAIVEAVCELRRTPGVIRAWLAPNKLADSWIPMRDAYEWFHRTHASGMYQEIFFRQHVKFQYPPSSLLLFLAARVAHIQLTATRLNYLSVAFAILECVALGLIVYVSIPATFQASLPKSARIGLSVLVAILSLTFFPLQVAVDLGQIQAWLNTFFVLACLCWLRNRRFAAGVLVGLICLVKPQFGLFLIWALLRREHRFILGWAAAVVPGEALSIAYFGFANHLDYLSALSFLGRHGEVFYPNQSVNGLLNRLLGTGDSLVWNMYGFPPYNPIVYFGTVATSLIFLGFAMFYRRAERPANVFDFLIAGLTFTIASPIAWEHHYGILPAAILLAAIAATALQPRQRTIVWILLALIWGISARRVYPSSFAGSGWASIPHSYLFLASLALLIILYRLRDVGNNLGKVNPSPRPANPVRTP